MNWLEVISTIVGSGMIAQLIAILNKRHEQSSSASRMADYSRYIQDLETVGIKSDSMTAKSVHWIARRAAARSLAREIISDHSLAYVTLFFLSLILGIAGIAAAESNGAFVGLGMFIPLAGSTLLLAVINPAESRIRHLFEEIILLDNNSEKPGAEEVKEGKIRELKSILNRKSTRLILGAYQANSLKTEFSS